MSPIAKRHIEYREIERPISPLFNQQPTQSLINTLKNIPEILIFLAFLAFSTSFLYFQHFRDFYTPDSQTYIAPAANLLAGKGFTDPAGFPETLRTPGYPLLIIPFLWAHLDLKYLVLLQHLVRLFIVLGTAAFGYQISGSRLLALAPGILLCVDLPMLEATNAILTEIFFTAILGTMLWLLSIESGRTEPPGLRCLVSGLLSGASVLVRPVALFFFVPATVYLWLTRRTFRMRAALIFVLSFTCLPLIWAFRNYSRTSYFTVSEIPGINLLVYRAAGTLAINDHGDFPANLEKRQRELTAQACEDLSRLYVRNCDELPVPQKAEYYSRLGRTILLQHPIAYVRLALRGTAVMMLDGGPNSLAAITGVNPHLGIRLLLVYTFPVFCLAILGFVAFWNQNRKLFYLFSVVVLYFVIISSGAEAYSRLRVPIEPLYAILVAAGLDRALKLSVGHHGMTLRNPST